MARKAMKSFGWLAGIVAIGIAAFFGFEYLQYRTSEEYQAEKFVKNWERQYAEDTYGGDTPEETLQLFISALKQGDTELAAKYFVVDKQQEWREDLAKIKEKNLLGEMIKDLERVEKTKETMDEVFYVATNDENIVSVQLILGKNSYSNKWKIIEL